MPVWRGQVPVRGRADQCPDQPLPQLPEAVLCARLFDQKALTVEGGTTRFASSEALDWVFWKTCGTRLFS
jgi:hypothetical protein